MEWIIDSSLNPMLPIFVKLLFSNIKIASDENIKKSINEKAEKNIYFILFLYIYFKKKSKDLL